MVLFCSIAHRIASLSANGGDYSNIWPHFRVCWRSRGNFACKHNKRISYFAYGLAPIHYLIVNSESYSYGTTYVYIYIYISIIARTSFEYRLNENFNVRGVFGKFRDKCDNYFIHQYFTLIFSINIFVCKFYWLNINIL